MTPEAILQSVVEEISRAGDLQHTVAFARLEGLLGGRLAKMGEIAQARAIFETSMTRSWLRGSLRAMSWVLCDAQAARALTAKQLQLYWKFALGLAATRPGRPNSKSLGNLARAASDGEIDPETLDIQWDEAPPGWPDTLGTLYKELVAWGATPAMVRKCRNLLQACGSTAPSITMDPEGGKAEADSFEYRLRAIMSAARDGSDPLFIVDLLHCCPDEQRDVLAWRAISTLMREQRADAAESVADWCSARIRCLARFRLAKLLSSYDREAAIEFVKGATELAGAIEETWVRADAYTRAYALFSAWGMAEEAAEARTQAAVVLWLSRPGESADIARLNLLKADARFGDGREIKTLASQIRPQSWDCYVSAWTVTASWTAQQCGMLKALAEAGKSGFLAGMVQRLALAEMLRNQS